jgi:hypothetical protein
VYGEVDLSFLDNLSLSFLTRYNPPLVDLLAEPLRSRLAEVFHTCGIAPYEDRDWEELAIIRRFFKEHFPRFRDIEE